MKYNNSISLGIKIIGVLIISFISTPIYIFSQEVDSFSLADEYLDKAGANWGINSDSVFYYINKSNEVSKQIEYWEGYIYTLNAYCSYYDLKNDFQKRRDYARLAYDESNKYLKETDRASTASLSNHSQAFLDVGNYSVALENFKHTLELEIAGEHYGDALSTIKTIGKIYDDLGDLDQAIEYYDECFNFETKHPGSMNIQNRVDIHKKRGNAYLQMNNLEKAHSDLKKAYEALPKDKIEKANVNNLLVIEINYGFAEIQLHKNNLDSLHKFVDRAFKYCKGDFKNDKDDGYALLANYHLKSKNSDKAIPYYLKSQRYARNKYKNSTKHKEFSDIFNNIGNAYLIDKNYKKALSSFKNSIINLASQGSYDKEKLVPIVDDLFNPYTSMRAYEGLGQAYYNLYLDSNDTLHLKASNLSFDIATDLIFEVRKTYLQDNSLLRFSEEVLQLYESAIEAALTMHNLTGDEDLLSLAFNYNEKSKAILLLESINESMAMRFSNIPDSLLAKEEELKYSIATLNRRIYDQQNTIVNQNDVILSEMKQLLFSDKTEYENLIKQFENSYPEYFKLKYDNSLVSIEDIQSKLERQDQQLIEFFYGEEFIYVFSISKDEFKVNKIPRNPELDKEIHKVKDFLNSPPSSENIELDLKKYIKCSSNIFKKLIKSSIFQKTKHLIFISDGPLSYIPFEALITSDSPVEKISFSLDNLAYLIENYLVSYSYSSRLFINSFKSGKKGNKNIFLGVAPTFEQEINKNVRTCNENSLFNLQCSEEEVRNIKDLFGGKVLIGQDATLENIKNEISSSNIIHLATHACLDDNNPEFNKIYLTDDYLSNNDLYNLELNSELAVLSACETGSGRLAKGEGVMSVARGFIHAGCPSIVMSLWSIDDCATSKIMQEFYSELYRGSTKAEALRNSKLKYIRESKKANQHPYYWAAFVQIGNYNPIQFSSSNKYYYFGGALLLLIVLIFLFKKNTSS